MNLRLFLPGLLLRAWRATHGATRIAAILTKGAVGAGILLLNLLVHGIYSTPFHA